MRTHFLIASLLAALLAPAFAASPAASPAAARAGESAKPAPTVPALKKAAIVGASISAGIGLDPDANPFAGEKSKFQLAHVVEASILGAHETPWNGADYNFFSSAEGIAKRSAADAKAQKPTVLVALDYLFWLAHGPGNDDTLLARVDAGLKHLAAFTCPVLLGDLPDFRGAGTNPFYLPPESIPPAETLAAANKRIYAWAKERPNVVVVPQAELLRKVLAGQPVTAGGRTFEQDAPAQLLQADRLHTTLVGTCALWATAVEAWRAQDPTIPAEAFLLEPYALAEKAEKLGRAAAEGQKRKPKSKAKSKAEAGG